MINQRQSFGFELPTCTWILSLFWSGGETGKHIADIDRLLVGKLAWLLFFYVVHITNDKCCFVNTERTDRCSVNKRSRIAFSIARAPLGQLHAVLLPTGFFKNTESLISLSEQTCISELNLLEGWCLLDDLLSVFIVCRPCYACDSDRKPSWLHYRCLL